MSVQSELQLSEFQCKEILLETPSVIIYQPSKFVGLSHDAGIKVFWWIILPRTVKSAYCVPLTAMERSICQRWAATLSSQHLSSQLLHQLYRNILYNL